MRLSNIFCFFIGALSCLVFTGIVGEDTSLLRLVIYAGCALSVTLLWRKWARNTIAERRDRQDRWERKKEAEELNVAPTPKD